MNGPEPKITATMGGVMSDAKDLLISEFALAKLEFQREFLRLKAVAITIAVGSGIALLGLIALVFMVVHLLAAFTIVPLWGCFGIVGGVLALTGALMLFSGRGRG